MATKKRASGRIGKSLNRGWVLLLLGLGIGIAAVFLGQLVTERKLHRTVTGWFKTERPAPAPEPARTRPKKYDFYTILPETETVLPERDARTPKPPKPEENISYILQAGSFPTFDDADQLKAKLALQGLTAHIQKVSIEGRGEYHRVRLGPYRKLEELDAATQQLSAMGIKALRLKVTNDTP